MKLDDLPTPALIVDLDRLERNIENMADRARRLGVRLRPHIKTHKCLEIGRLQRDAGAHGITVSTLDEARAFADGGFDDITWAFPVAPSHCHDAARLARQVRLGVVVDSTEAVAWLAAADFPFATWLKVDCGYHRSGVAPALEATLPVVEAMQAAGLRFAGLLSHSGNAYECKEFAARSAVAETERETLVRVGRDLESAGVSVPELSVGSTPGMTAARDLTGVTEARPGNYAYFDRMQLDLGSCTLPECALSVVSTVVSSSAAHAVCDAGALVMSKDPGPADGNMGAIWKDYETHLDPEIFLTSLSQEHGKLSAPLPLGTRVRILPNHSCLTAACFARLHAVRGERVEEVWRVWNAR